MDDTQQSRVSDAAAIRKRRSSILKNQRPPRAPLSELEFHVATPTDTAKSRRVSFSRKFGVAEFVTNEATTTWKNFYEEHNKTLESSGNESEVNPPVGHLGKRIFDQQCQEVELIDFSFNMPNARNGETSLKAINYEDFTDVNPPNSQKFEISAFTEQSKVFADDLAVSGVGEVSGKINVNFSMMQPIGDDLDEMQKDLERNKAQNVVCPGPKAGRDVSEYIEIDLNTTHIALKCDQSDMSITDTIHSPKVNVSKTNSLLDKSDKSLNKDWVADKENIAVNPYVAPKESANFAINEDTDKVLVFDGKRLTVQSQNEPISDYRKMLLPNLEAENTPQRKSIVLNIDDDLPNFVDDPLASVSQLSRNLSVHSKTSFAADLSLTQALPTKIESKSSKRLTILYGEKAGDISMTQALPTNILPPKSDKRNTIVFDDDAIEVTQAISSNIILAAKDAEKRKTIVFDNDEADISVTQAVPSHLLLAENAANISEKRKTTLLENSTADMSHSVSKAETSAVISKTQNVQKRNTNVFDHGEADISMTVAVPSTLIFADKDPEKRKTICFEDNSGDISITQAIPANIIVTKDYGNQNKKNNTIFEADTDISFTQVVSTALLPGNSEKRKSILLDTDKSNTTMTQAVSANRISSNKSIIFNDFDKKYNEQILEANATKNLTINVSTNNVTKDVEKEFEDPKLKTPCITLQKNQLSESYSNRSFEQIVSPTLKLESIKHQSSSPKVDKTNSRNENIISPMFVEPEEYKKRICDITSSLRKTLIDINKTLPTFSSEKKIILPERKSLDFSRQKHGGPHVCDSSKSFSSVNSDSIKSNERSELKINLSVEYSDDLYQLSARSSAVTRNESTVRVTDLEVKSSSEDSFTTEKPNTLLKAKNTLNPIPEELGMRNDHISKALDNSRTRKSIGDCKFENVLVYQVDTALRRPSQQGDLMSDGSSSGGVLHKSNFSNNSLSMSRAVRSHETSSECVQDANTSKIGAKAEAKPSADYSIIDSESAVIEIQKTIQKSLLDDLLDMSNEDEAMVEKIKAKLSAHLTVAPKKEQSESNIKSSKEASDESMFFIVNDTETEKTDSCCNSVKKVMSRRHSPVQIEYETGLEELRHKLLKKESPEKMSSKTSNLSNRKFEIIVSSGSNGESIDMHCQIKDPETTRDLLDLLSEFTNQEEEKHPIEPSDAQNRIEIQNPDKEKKDVDVGTQKSYKVLLASDEIYSDISVAVPMRERSCGSDVAFGPEELEPIPEKHKKTVRLSPEVVKTLRFEDEDSIENQNKFEMEMSTPLKKSPVSKSPEMFKKNENKCHVIPSYWKDVSESLKAVMSDLVKPLADTLPFDAAGGRRVRDGNSMSSIHVQTNTIASSQIDLPHDDNEEFSSPPERKIKGIMKGTSLAHSISGPLCDEWSVADYWKYNQDKSRHSQEHVIPFDPGNPLNNVLIGPIDFNNVHSYQPESKPEPNIPVPPPPQVCFRDVDEEATKRITTNYNVPRIVPEFLRNTEGRYEKAAVSTDLESTKVEHAVETTPSTKDADINTDIAMKDNSKLLEEDSSLTLVDNSSEHLSPKKLSPVQTRSNIIRQTQSLHSQSTKQIVENKSSMDAAIFDRPSTFAMHYDGLSGLEPIEEDVTQSSPKKNKLKNTKRKSQNLKTDTPPKPSSKIYRASNPVETELCSSSFSSSDSRNSKNVPYTPRNPKNPKNPKTPKSKPLPEKSNKKIVMVQQVPELDTSTNLQEKFDDSIILAKRYDCDSVSSIRTEVEGLITSQYSSRSNLPMDWEPELLNDLSSKNLISECDSNVDVVAIIDNMPFMGSRECQWESCNDTMWTFLLLYARVRLSVSLGGAGVGGAGRGAGAVGRGARAHAPVTNVTVQPTDVENRNMVAVLCSRYAVLGIRQRVVGCARAADVPALLRRAAGTARVALRWGQAMHEAYLHLAFNINKDSLLTLKVANIPLRSVWEVTMQLEMPASSQSGGSCPRARDVRVRAVLSDYPVPPEHVHALVQGVRDDWGNIPATIWKIFQYLKHYEEKVNKIPEVLSSKKYFK